MASSGPTRQTELRLVLLGRSGAGKSSAAQFILGRQNTGPQTAQPQTLQPQTLQALTLQAQDPQPQDPQPQTTQPQTTQPQTTQPQTLQALTLQAQDPQPEDPQPQDPQPVGDAGADGEGTAGPQECVKLRGMAAGRQVAVVDTPDWLSPQRPPEERRRLVSSCAALSAPGPHAFLLCVPVGLAPPAEEEEVGEAALGDLDVLESVLGPAAVRGHTLVLFTHTEQLSRGLEEHLTSLRPDLLELVARCGHRYHALERGGGGVGEGGGGEKRSVEEEEGEERRRRRSVAELVEKVLEMGRDSGEEFYGGPLFQQAEARVRGRQRELVRERGEGGGGGGGGGEGEEPEDEQEMESVRAEAESSVNDLDVDLDDVPSLHPPSSLSSSSSSPSSPSWLGGLWAWLAGWLRAVPGLVRLEALLGSVVGLFVGGPVGGALGAAVRSVTAEVGKRKVPKAQKNK